MFSSEISTDVPGLQWALDHLMGKVNIVRMTSIIHNAIQIDLSNSQDSTCERCKYFVMQ